MAKNIQFNVKLNVDGKEQLVTATTSVKDLQRAVEGSHGAVSNSLKSINEWGFALQNSVNSINAISSALGTMTDENRTFSRAMAEANTMAGKSGGDFARMKEQVSGLSKEIPMARDALATGLYQVISNGVPEDNWITYLEKSAKASVGGIADLEEVVKVTSTVIKNYGLEWDAAGEIQDKIQLTAKNGVTSFEQMAAALPRVTANAATLGISIDELMASLATLTGVSGNTAEVSTQLAAIMTALIKPSSEAANMAKEMGIQFDAAAIKAAGGMQNFLTSLDTDIKSYAASTGKLESEVYGRLFGSAEALRALTPLTGNLADKFAENVGAMKGSAGTIEDAFATMSSNGSATLQKLRNAMGDVTDAFAASISTIQTTFNVISLVGNAALPIVSLTKVLQQASVVQKLLTVSALRTTVAYAAFGTNTRRVAAALNVFANSSRSAATGAVAMKVALRGLLIASGVGIAIAAVSAAVGVLMDKCEAGASSVDTMTDAQRKAQEEAARQSAVQKKLGDSAGELVGKFKTLQAQWNNLKTDGEKTAFIEQNQSAFAELGLHIDDVNSAYNTFVSNAPKVVAALASIAKAEAWKDIYKDSIKDKATNFNKSFKYAKAKAGDKIATDSVTGEMSAEYKAAGVKGDGSGRLKGGIMAKRDYGNLTAEDAKRLNAYCYQQGLKRKRNEEQGYDEKTNEALRGFTEALREAETAKGVLGSAGKSIAAGTPTKSGRNTTRPRNTNTPEETAPEGSLKYLSDKLSDIRAQIDVEIDPDKRKQLVKDYDAVKEEIEKAEIDCGLRTPEASEVKTELDELKARLASKQKDFDNAITIDAKVQAACEVAKLQSEIDTATHGQLSIPAYVESEYVKKGSADDKRQSYSNAQNKASRIQTDLEIGLIGKDEAKKQLDELNQQLKELGLKPVEVEIKSKGFDEVFGSIKSGWGSIQGVGNGIQGITEALEGDGNAWEKITGLLNGFISIAEGIQGIVELINFLTGATTAHTAAASADAAATETDAVAKTEDAGATTADAAAKGAAAGATTTDTAAKVADTAATTAHTTAATTDAVATQVDTVATETNTVAKSGQAIAGATASGASMPFPLNIVAIAMGVAAVIAALSTAFATGGVVGGTSTSGDKKFARVNSGEMILNKFQQTRLFHMVNGDFQPPTFTERSMPQIIMPNLANAIEPANTQVNVTLNADARKMLTMMSNTKRVAAKSGRNYNV